MPAWVRLVSIVCITTCVGITPTRAIGNAPVAVQKCAQKELAYGLQVRLRRLHLVRPDLIPYPIEVEVVC
jgi:hypothetical protein